MGFGSSSSFLGAVDGTHCKHRPIVMERSVDGLLIDLDGVVYVGDQVVSGAKEALEEITAAGVPRRFITNTTTSTASQVVAKLNRLGFSVHPEEVFSAVTATKLFLQQQKGGSPKVHLLVAESIRTEFEEFAYDIEENPDYVVIGDIGATWNYAMLNTAFQCLHKGAELIAMHKNKFWQTHEGLSLDIGAFVAGLEYVSGQTARIIGKPSPDFFRLGVNSLGLAAANVAMVG